MSDKPIVVVGEYIPHDPLGAAYHMPNTNTAIKKLLADHPAPVLAMARDDSKVPKLEASYLAKDFEGDVLNTTYIMEGDHFNRHPSLESGTPVAIKGLDVDFDPFEIDVVHVPAYIHFIAGHQGFDLRIPNRVIHEWLKEGVKTANDLMTRFYKGRMDTDNFRYHSTSINNFVLAFRFPGINTANYRTFAYNVFMYLITDDQKHLNPLNKKRKADLLSAKFLIGDARKLLGEYIRSKVPPFRGTVKIGYTIQ